MANPTTPKPAKRMLQCRLTLRPQNSETTASERSHFEC